MSPEKARFKTPSRLIEPLAVTRSELALLMEKLLMEPDVRLRLPEPPVMARGLLPALFGARMPPALMVVAVTVPLPESVAPLLITSPEDGAMDPSTLKVAVSPTLVLPV